MQNEIINKYINTVEIDFNLDLDPELLPEVIQNQLSKLNELDAKVNSAIISAEEAEAEMEKASRMKTGLFQKQAAIERLQTAGIMLAKAVQAGTEAQKISFEFQKKISEVTKFLFHFGAGNIAANRIIVRALEMHLKGASENEISNLAQQELSKVLKQLKAQEDLHIRQETIINRLKEHDKTIRDLNDKVEQDSKTLKLHETALATHEVKIDTQGAALSKVLVQYTQLQSKIEMQQQMITSLTTELELRKARENELSSMIDRANISALELKTNLDSMATSVDSNLKRGNILATALALFSIAGLVFVYFTK